MKQIVLILSFLFLSAGGARVHAQIVSASLAEIRNIETKFDSMERVITGTVEVRKPVAVTGKWFAHKGKFSHSDTGASDERFVVRDKFRHKKGKRVEVRHKRISLRDFQFNKKVDLRVKILRVNGKIIQARAKDQATRTKWVYHSSGYLKVKQPGSLKVWYYKQL